MPLKTMAELSHFTMKSSAIKEAYEGIEIPN
jgi:hypothetical protein